MDAPPAGHTGGFGERTCAFCHAEFEPATEGLALAGLPARYEPGASYPLTLTLTDQTMAVAGFEAAIRFAEGTRAGAQAGSLTPGDARASATDSAGVTYVHHRRGGQPVTGDGQAAWDLVWTAPAEGGRVLLHAAANAANGDYSEFGDLIVTAMFESASR